MKRLAAVDAVRGLAVLLMIVDHVSMFVGLEPLRWTFGRFAMPLFFLLSGALVSRLRVRHGLALALGLALPVFVPWLDVPNLLVLFAVGSALIVLWERAGWRVEWLGVVLAALAANRVELVGGSGYEPYALLGLMVLGRVVGLGWCERLRLPGWVAKVGEYPLTWYVGHIALLEGLRLWLLRG